MEVVILDTGHHLTFHLMDIFMVGRNEVEMVGGGVKCEERQLFTFQILYKFFSVSLTGKLAFIFFSLFA